MKPTALRFLAGCVWLAGLALLVTGCKPPVSNSFQGYVEGEYVYVGAPLAGLLQTLEVKRGQSVKAGDALFALEQEAERAAVAEGEKRLAQALARLTDLTKGKRPSEIAALEAQLESAQASLKYWETEYARGEKLQETRAQSAQDWDQIKSQRDTARAQVATGKANLETARLGAREDEIKAAQAETDALTAALDKAKWALGQKTQHSPATGVVHDTLYRTGEFVATGNPVVALLPPENIKVRFFVPEPRLTEIKAGNKVSVAIDGDRSLTATIAYISTQAEFTLPTIYSRENRSKLVYMVEAAFTAEDARDLHPGQPLDVRLGP